MTNVSSRVPWIFHQVQALWFQTCDYIRLLFLVKLERKAGSSSTIKAWLPQCILKGEKWSTQQKCQPEQQFLCKTALIPLNLKWQPSWPIKEGLKAIKTISWLQKHDEGLFINVTFPLSYKKKNNIISSVLQKLPSKKSINWLIEIS